ncbi:MAG: hypothetical protein SGBAC_012716 [Bacillariaceae sp.]
MTTSNSNSGFRTASSMMVSSTASGGIPPPPVAAPLSFLSSSPQSQSQSPTAPAIQPTATGNVQNMTFSNLYKLLQQVVQNRQLYETSKSVTFRVAMLQKNNKADQIHFNIGKNKDFQKNPLNSRAQQNNNNNKLLLACKLPSSLMEPYFEISALELRALSKTDRVKCDRIVREGGDKVRAKFFPQYLQYYKAKLLPTVEEVFGATAATGKRFALDNVQTPILFLEPDKMRY